MITLHVATSDKLDNPDDQQLTLPAAIERLIDEMGIGAVPVALHNDTAKAYFVLVRGSYEPNVLRFVFSGEGQEFIRLLGVLNAFIELQLVRINKLFTGAVRELVAQYPDAETGHLAVIYGLFVDRQVVPELIYLENTTEFIERCLAHARPLPGPRSSTGTA
jgi:hypothetical protein